MTDMLRVSTNDGKYTVVQDESGKLTALRYGEPWRDCVGDNLILMLAYELSECRIALDRIAHYDEQPLWSDDRDDAANAMLDIAREVFRD